MNSGFNGFTSIAPNLRHFGLGIGKGGALQTQGPGVSPYNYNQPNNVLPAERGIGSVDLQIIRTSSAQTATGPWSMTAGISCTASGYASFALGSGCSAQGGDSYAFGIGSGSSGETAVAFGYQCFAEREASFASGHRAYATLPGQFARACGNFENIGDAQTSYLIARAETTNDTPTSALIGNYNATGYLYVPNNSTWLFDILVVARRTDADDESAAYRFQGCIDRNGYAGSTALVGSVTKSVLCEDSSAWDADVTADSTNGAINITVTGESGKTIRWVAFVRTVEVTG